MTHPTVPAAPAAASKPPEGPPQERRLPRWALSAVYAVGGVLGMTIGLIGLSVSFQTIAALAEALGLPGWSWLYPVGIDVGILTLLLLDWIFVMRGRNAWPLRAMAWLLTGFTVWVNSSGGASGGGAGHGMDTAALEAMGIDRTEARSLQSGLHMVMPVLWVVMIEAARYLVVHDRRDKSGASAREIPLVRWVLSPVRTALLFRRMRLWDVSSYRLALTMEAARLHGIDIVRSRMTGNRVTGWWRRLTWKRQIPRLLRKDLTSGNMPDDVREEIAALVAAGRTTGWRRHVYWWVVGELENREPAPIADADADSGATVEGGAGAAPEGPPAGHLGGPSLGALEGSRRALHAVAAPPSGGASGTPSGGPSGTPSGGASATPSKGASGGGGGTPSGPPSKSPSGGPSKGASRKPSKTARPAAGKTDARINIDGLGDDELIDKHIAPMALEYEADKGGEITPSHLVKNLQIGHTRAKRVIELYYDGQKGVDAAPAALAEAN